MKQLLITSVSIDDAYTTISGGTQLFRHWIKNSLLAIRPIATGEAFETRITLAYPTRMLAEGFCEW